MFRETLTWEAILAEKTQAVMKIEHAPLSKGGKPVFVLLGKSRHVNGDYSSGWDTFFFLFSDEQTRSIKDRRDDKQNSTSRETMRPREEEQEKEEEEEEEKEQR